MMKVLFLDLDGVVHPSPLSDGDQHFQWLPNLRALLRGRAGVGIAVHSTWRYTYTARELQDLLIDVGTSVLGATPRGPRYESILWWLHLNPQFKDYRILDDAAGEFPQPAPAELLLCDPAEGILTRGVLDSLEQWLDSPQSYTPGK